MQPSNLRLRLNSILFKGFCLVFFLFLLLFAGLFFDFIPLPTEDRIMEEFYRGGDAEIMNMDPLILHPHIVKHRVIREIQDKNMPMRRYAIGFLGNCQIVESLPVLDKILFDDAERDYFRADALESIHQIDSVKGLKLAELHADRDDFLGYIAKKLANGEQTYYVRTYSEALSGWKD